MKPETSSPEADDAPRPSVEPAVWERLPGESAKWFARFNTFRLLGSERSIDMTWRRENQTKTNKNGRAPDSWHKVAKRLDWRERALAWDLAEAEKYRRDVVDERDRRLKLTLQYRQRREGYIVALDRSLHSHAERLRNKDKLNAEEYRRSIEWSEARLQAHYDFVERLLQLSHTEFVAEEKMLTVLATHQQYTEVGEVPPKNHNLTMEERKHITSTRPALASGDSATENSSNNPSYLSRQ